MKKAFIILLCALAVFAIVSCKNEPKPEPEPAPAKPVVTFDTQGGSAITAVTVEKDAKVVKPTDPTMAAATFYAWYTEATFENEYDFDTPVTESMTLFAKWILDAPEEVETFKLTSTRGSDGWQLQWLFDAENAIKAGDVISFKYKSNREFKSFTIRKMTGDKATSGKLADGTALVEDVADADDWHTFTYTVEGTVAATDIGIGLRLETKDGNTAVGDVLYIKDITYKTATATKKLAIADGNLYYGCEPTIENSFIRLVATKGGKPVGDTHNYDFDKFTLYWNPNVQVNPGDVFSITFKPLRRDPLTKGRDFTYSIRDAKKWFSEKDSSSAYPQGWSTFSEPDVDGWITATYVFPAADAETKEAITYPATFRVDFRDETLAAPEIGCTADILYIRSATITTPDPEDPAKTITTPLVLDAAKSATKYASPAIVEFFAPAAE